MPRRTHYSPCIGRVITHTTANMVLVPLSALLVIGLICGHVSMKPTATAPRSGQTVIISPVWLAS